MPKGSLRTEAGKLETKRINKREAAVLASSAKQIAKCTYDFQYDGQDALEFSASLPAGSFVTNVYASVETALNDATGFALSVGGTDIAIAATGTNQADLEATGAKELTKEAASEVSGKIALASFSAATAGKVHFAIEFVDTSRIK